ncbi:MAG: hypothetical protein ACOYT9_03450 [Patescibacteria group bacterium]
MATLETFNTPQRSSTETFIPDGCKYAYHLVLPESAKRVGTPLRVLIWGHGSIHKNGDYQHIIQESTVDALELVPYCERYGIAAIVPILPRKGSTLHNPPLDAQSLNRATLLNNIDPYYFRPDIDILTAATDVIKKLQQQGHEITDKLMIGGVSAGALMANRLAFLYPELFSAVVMLKAGAFSLPLKEYQHMKLSYPYGAGDIEQVQGNTYTPDSYAKLPFFIYFGEKDNNFPREELHIGGSLSVEQIKAFGSTPTERMTFFVNHMKKLGSTFHVEIGAGLAHQLENDTVANAFQFLDLHTKKR